MVAPASALQAAAGPRAARRCGALRRAALPLELQLPRRCEPSRRARGRSGAPRPRSARAHRPRRLLRRGPLRRSRARDRPAHRVRRRAHARCDRPAERRRRSCRITHDRARRRARRLRAARPRDQPRADGRGEGRAAHFARSARRREPHERRPPLGRLVGAQRLSKRCGVLRARRARPCRSRARAAAPRRRVRS